MSTRAVVGRFLALLVAAALAVSVLPAATAAADPARACSGATFVGTLTWAYGYDNDGIRTSTTDPYGVTTTYTWDKANPAVPLLLTETTSGQTTRYIYGPGGVPVEQINPNGTVTYLHHDQLGSVRVTTNATGATIGAVTYAPYGNLAATNGALGTRFGFAGQYTDPETGFQYLRARYYDPGTAQFLSLDPLHNLTGERYGYTGGNPLNATDPTGMWAMGALRIIGQVAVFGAATLGAIACGATIVCGAAVGAAAGFGYYAAANAGSDRWSWTQAAGWAAAGGIAGWFGAAEAGGAADALGAGTEVATNTVDDVIAETTNATTRDLTSAHTLTADEALEAGQQWVGDGYTELGKPGSGVFRSADGTRQFRIDDGSLTGAHAPGVPHVHLEVYAPGARIPSVNNHIPFVN